MSIRMEGPPGRWVRKVRVSEGERAGWVVVERSWDQVVRDRGVVGVPRRVFVEREIRMRDTLGWVWLRWESWERKCVPTPPTPIYS